MADLRDPTSSGLIGEIGQIPVRQRIHIEVVAKYIYPLLTDQLIEMLDRPIPCLWRFPDSTAACRH